jgi:hypothetical protein
MAWALRAVAFANGRPCHIEGQFLHWFDPDIPDATRVMAEFTDDVGKAKLFATVEAALDEWQRVRRVDPVRPDGVPNKPLTALTMELVEI